MTRDPALPFVTFYDESTGERTELSTTSLRNWQAKTANYLRDGIGLEAGGRVGLYLPPHWVSTAWLAACRSLGLTATLGEVSDNQLDVAVIGPAFVPDPPPADEVVACSLRPFAMPFVEALPSGVEDYFAEVRNFGDYFSSPAPARATALLNLGETDLTATGIAELVAQQVAEHQLSVGDRILIAPPEPSHSLVLPTAEQLLALYDLPLATGGSVVIVMNASAERISAIADQERVTARLGD